MKQFAAAALLQASNAAFLTEEANEVVKRPTVVFHGINSTCKDHWHGDGIAKHVGEMTGMHSECIEIQADHEDTASAWTNSIFGNFNEYVMDACDRVRKNPHFNNGQEFNLIGLSQGSLVARNLVENCPDLKVRNFFTLGGPHMGVSAIPFCTTGVVCTSLNYIAESYSTDPTIQDSFHPAAYYRDVDDIPTYLKNSIFLPQLNNQKEYSEQRKTQMLKLHKAVFAMTTGDEVVYPKESAIFGELHWDGSVLPRHETELWKKDLLGLKQMEQEGRAIFLTAEGAHIHLTK